MGEEEKDEEEKNWHEESVGTLLYSPPGSSVLEKQKTEITWCRAKGSFIFLLNEHN